MKPLRNEFAMRTTGTVLIAVLVPCFCVRTFRVNSTQQKWSYIEQDLRKTVLEVNLIKSEAVRVLNVSEFDQTL